MAHATATQTPNETRRALVREVSRLLCEMRIMFHDVETDVILLAQRKCPVSGERIEQCEGCRNAALGNAPFALSKHAHASELKAMINAISPALLALIEKSILF